MLLLAKNAQISFYKHFHKMRNKMLLQETKKQEQEKGFLPTKNNKNCQNKTRKHTNLLNLFPLIFIHLLLLHTSVL